MELARWEIVKESISRAMEIQKKIKKLKGNFAVEFIREDRDAR